MSKIGHGMWINSLYLWLVICSKSPCNRYLLFRGFSPGHMACGWQGQDKILPCHNPFDVLSYSPRNSENADNWWQLLGTVSHFHYSPGPAIAWAPKAQGRVSWVSLTPNMWCLSKQHPIPQTPTGCATTQFNSDRKSGELTYILHVEVSELSSLQRPAMWAHPSWFDKVSKTGKFHYLTPCSITQLIRWPNSGRPLT